LECEITGGAGTDFRPVFAFVEQNFDDVKLLLYFSDLEGIFPNAAPSYDVKWISAQEKEVPFGELILL
jgi:predicted metal-dependent peptidase